MRSHSLSRRVAIVAGGAALVTMVGLTAGCGESKEETPTTTTTTTTTAPPPVSPTEKVGPTDGNKFTPPVTAPGPFTPAPGDGR